MKRQSSTPEFPMEEMATVLSKFSFDENKQPKLRKLVLSQWYMAECRNCHEPINLITDETSPEGFKVCPSCGMLN